MIELPDRPVSLRQLNRELAALNLPDFSGVARLVRRGGQPSLPYLLVKCGPLTPEQQGQVEVAVAVHVPTLAAPPRDWAGELDKATTLTEVKTWLRGYLHP